MMVELCEADEALINPTQLSILIMLLVGSQPVVSFLTFMTTHAMLH